MGPPLRAGRIWRLMRPTERPSPLPATSLGGAR
jgi:hypothetical protein